MRKRYFVLVPSEGPDYTWYKVLSASSAIIEWSEIYPEYHNGKLLGYSITYFPECFKENFHSQHVEQFTVDLSFRSHTITGLQPGTKYRVYIAGFTARGVGEHRDIEFFTRELPLVLIFKVLLLQWCFTKTACFCLFLFFCLFISLSFVSLSSLNRSPPCQLFGYAIVTFSHEDTILWIYLRFNWRSSYNPVNKEIILGNYICSADKIFRLSETTYHRFSFSMLEGVSWEIW